MAIKANLIIDQGTSYVTSVDITDDNDDPVSLVGYTGTAQIRKHYTSTNSVSFGVTVTPAEGVVTLSLTPAQTSSLKPGRYVYDVSLVSSGNVVSRIVEGIATVTPQVTR